jgi:hypothetical protein
MLGTPILVALISISNQLQTSGFFENVTGFSREVSLPVA